MPFADRRGKVGEGGVMIRKVKVHALDRLLLERFGGKVGRGLAVRERHQLPFRSHHLPSRVGIEHHGAEHPRGLETVVSARA
jgi:hypothetical protein